MRLSQRIDLERVALRAKANEAISALNSADEPTDELRTAMTEATAALSLADTRHGEALAAEAVVDIGNRATMGNRQGDDLAALADRASVGAIMAAATNQRGTVGAEREIQEEFGLSDHQIPLEMFAITPAPTNTEGNQQPTVMPVFAGSIAAFLGIYMPVVPAGDAVFPVLVTKPTVGIQDADVAITETTARSRPNPFPVRLLRRPSAGSGPPLPRFPGMEDALREALNAALGNAMDRQIIRGAVIGLLTGTVLANHAAGGVTSFAQYISRFGYSRVDGEFASTAADLRIVMGSGTYAHAGSVYRGTNSEETALDRLIRATGGIRVSPHVPAVSGSDKQNAIIRRGSRRDFVAPIWNGIALVRDEYSGSQKTEVQLTAIMLANWKLIRSGGFYKQEVQVP